MSFNNTSDEYWAEKLRRENCDQFNTLVRMHLSFVLDLNTDDNECITEKTKFKKWSFVPFVKKSKCPNRGVMDGAPLTQEGICQVYQLIEYLSKEPNINAEGIFRRTGSLTRQQELRALLNQGQPLNLDGGRYSVHDCASVLKGFLAELPEPLLTDAHYPAHCQIAELCINAGTPQAPAAETRLLQALQLLLLLLPTENRVLLRDVLQLLNDTASREPSNKMSADSLATLFTPHLLCPRRLSPEALHTDSQTLSGIVAFMIRRGVGLFEIPPKLALDIRSYFTSATADRSPAANTVYSFVDRERTARAHATDPTETALAQLYAYIQGLPESSKKRKLVKQFNRQNGQGTPLQAGAGLHSKSLGDSIKRHFFFHKALKRTEQRATRLRSSSEEVLSETMMTPRSRKPVLLMSGTNACGIPKMELLKRDFSISSLLEEEQTGESSISRSRSVLSTESPVDASFSSRTDDYGYSCNSMDTSPLLDDENQENQAPDSTDMETSRKRFASDLSDPIAKRHSLDKEPILKPTQYNSDGEAVVFETSF